MSNNNLTYPVKYAVLELIDEFNTTFGFIASKCYVIEDVTRYLPDGSNREYHKVVFPYTNIVDYKQKIYYDYQTQDIGHHNIPEYDLCGNICNAYITTKVFDNYDDAYIYAIVNNQQLIENLIFKLPWSHPNYEKEREEINLKFSLDMTTCEKFEELILKQTKDMKLASEKECPADSEVFDTHKKLIRILINKRRDEIKK